MGGCRCSYKNCPNTTKTTENVHFFHYPVKHKERCKIWIENASKPHFCDLEEDQLRNKVVCETHFEDRWFPNFQKKRLLQGAIPTLDGGSIVPDKPEQEIQVLPANDDGTLFVLDTDSMFKRSQKVDSYIYKNGIIVPSTNKPAKFKPVPLTKPSTSLSSFSSVKEENHPPITLNAKVCYDSDMINQPIEHVAVKNEVPEYVESNRLNSQNNTFIEYEPEKSQFNEQNMVKSMIRRNFAKNQVPKSTVEKTIGRTYLHKIKQHSRDIASIKRMLKQKSLTESKPDGNSFLNSMKEQLPPSFFTILNLNLNNKIELSDDDIDFFTTIHKMSPEVYQLLCDKYKWNLPCVDIVESPME